MEISRRTVLGMLASVSVTSAQAAPRSALLDRRWAGFGQGAGPDHQLWRDVLRRGRRMGADGIARFDYRGVARDQVSAYIEKLEQVDPTLISRPAAFAFWVNLYNAVTVRVVQEAYPVKSIREIGGGLFTKGPWRTRMTTIAGQHLSLDDIEHGILRPVWNDPRVHYAVNCAALGCPDLAAEPYEAGSLSAMLDLAARNYVNHPRGVEVTSDRITLSSIYDWYGEDFGATANERLAHIASYANQSLKQKLSAARSIAGYRYDWALNDI